MARLKTLFLLLIFILILSAAVPVNVDGAANLVGVRVLSGANASLDQLNVDEDILINYGAFSWSVMSPSDLSELDAAGFEYQAFDNPYDLNLGGQTFDPLVSMPQFGMTWENIPETSEPGLRLVQFFGPTKPEWLDLLDADGLDIIQYIHPFTYVVWGDSASLEKARAQKVVRWTGDFLPAYAVQPEYRILNSDPVLVRIMIYPKASLSATVRAVEALGGNLVGTTRGIDPSFDLASFNLPGDKLGVAAALHGVYAIQPVPLDGGDRGEMSNQINAGNYNSSKRAFPGYLAWLNSLGLSGEGVVIANVDSGIDQNHPDLFSRMVPCFGSTCGGNKASNHGTHTAGIMAGDGSSGVTDGFGFLRGLGMAPGANLVEQVYSPTYTLEGGMIILMTQSHRNNAVISGNSWGPSGSQKGYDLDTRWVDIGVRDADPDAPGNQPLSYVLSIMNGYGGESTQGTPDEAKNIITIGSTYMQGSTGAQSMRIDDLSPNSAHGPALDGRQIPHLVAPGCFVDSTCISPFAYALSCGTSMASPNVSGAAALFYQRYRNLYGVDPSPALVKAAFLPVAHDLAGNVDADGDTLGHPFDSKQGWGRLNAAAVLDPPGTVLYFDQETRFEKTGEKWEVSISEAYPFLTLRAMLVWTDAPGHGLGGYGPAWVNDLDLSISINGLTYYGNNFGGGGYSIPGGSPDEKNNTEGIFLADLPAGTYTFTVTAATIAGDGVPNVGSTTDQDFALVIYYSLNNEEQHNYIFPLFFR